MAQFPNEYHGLYHAWGYEMPLPAGLTFVPPTRNKVVIQLLQELTCARGRILYTVLKIENGNHKGKGYICPSGVAEIVKPFEDDVFRDVVSTDKWMMLSRQAMMACFEAHKTVKSWFPRISPIAAIRIAEKAQRDGWKGGKKELLDVVVSVLRDEWTSYQHRISPTSIEGEEKNPTLRDRRAVNLGYEPTQGKSAEEAFEEVKVRMREVLVAWLPPNLSDGTLQEEDFEPYDLRYPGKKEIVSQSYRVPARASKNVLFY